MPLASVLKKILTDLPRAGRRSFPGNGLIRRDLPVVEAGGLLSTLYLSGS